MVMLELSMLMMMTIMVHQIHRYIHYQDHNRNHQSRQHDLMKQYTMTVAMSKNSETDEFQRNLSSKSLIPKELKGKIEL